MEDFRECGEDFGGVLTRKRKVDREVVDATLAVLKERPLAGVERLRQEVCACLGREDLPCGNLEAALDQISCREVRGVLRKQLEAGEVYYKEAYLVARFFGALASGILSAAMGEASPLDVSEELCASFAHGTAPLAAPLGEVAEGLDDRGAQALAGLFGPEEELSSEELRSIWMGPLGVKLWAFVLYFHGVSLSVLGSWFGVHKSPVCSWLSDVAQVGWVWLQEQRAAFSGRAAVAEKKVKIAGVWWYLFAAVDCLTGYPLHIALYPSNSGVSCKLFLLGLARVGYLPKVIITDGWDGYIQPIREVFPHAEHRLCRFHLIRSVFRRLRKAQVYAGEVWQRVGSLFHPHDKRTVLRRVTQLQSLVEDLDVGPVVSGLLWKLPQVLGSMGSTWHPSTTNAVEWFFAAFERLYRIKGPFCDEASAAKHLQLFLLGYVSGLGAKGEACPLERTGVQVASIPFYHLGNRPNVVLLRDRMAEAYRQAA